MHQCTKKVETFSEDSVYLLAPHASSLQTGTIKFWEYHVGPLAIDTVLDSTHYK